MADNTILTVPQTTLPYVYFQPPADIPESQKDDDWYVKNNRYFTTFYNPLIPNFSQDDGVNTNRTVNDILNCFAYFKGQQRNVDFKAHTMDMNNNAIPAVWIKGQELSGMINYAVNVLEEQIAEVEWSAKSLSDESAQMWQEMNNKLRFMIDAKDSLKALGQVGIQYKPVDGAEDIQDHDDADAFMEDFKTESEMTAIEIADAIYESTFSKNVYLKAFLHVVVGAIGSVYTYVENGEVKKEHKAAYSVIIDNRHDDIYNRKAQFCGFVDRFTPSELYLKYPVLGANKAIREKVQAMAERNENYGDYQSYWNMGLDNLRWWDYQGNRMTIAVSTVFWIGLEDTRLVKGNNSHGNERYRKTNDEKVSGDYWIPVIYQSTIVGNQWLVEKGPMPNQVRDYRNKSNPMLPISNFLPEMEMGQPRSLTSRAINNQNEMDRLKFKIQELTANDLGVNYIINGKKLGDGIKAKDLVSDFKTMRIHIAEPSGERDNPDENDKTVETVDLSSNIDISQYIALYHEQERIQQRIFSFSDISLGQQQRTTGMKVQENTIAQNNLGTLGLYNGFMEFIRLDMQKSTNLWKLVKAKTNEASTELVVGKGGMKVIKMTAGFRFEDMLIFIEPNDNLDKESKSRIQQLAFANAQNNSLDFIDYIEGVEFARGKRDMVKKLKRSRKKQEQKMMQQQDQQQQMEAMMQQNQAQAAQNAIVIQEIAQRTAKLEAIDLQGSWAVRNTEVKNAGAVQNKEADMVIQHTIKEVDQAHEAAMSDITHQQAKELQASAPAG